MSGFITLRRLLLFVLVAGATHLGSVWLLPRVIMKVAIDRISDDSPASGNIVVAREQASGAKHTIVMPSPDLMYSTCAYDLGKGPLHVTADPRLQSYWSVALYSSTTDNFFAINDRQSGDKPLSLVLATEQQTVAAAAGAQVVRSPSLRGLLLMRVLLPADPALQEAARRGRATLDCHY